MPVGRDEVDLSTLLTAWNEATDRLQHTHEALQAEVRRLTDELEDKTASWPAKTGWRIWGRWPRTWLTRSATAWCL